MFWPFMAFIGFPAILVLVCGLIALTEEPPKPWERTIHRPAMTEDQLVGLAALRGRR